MGGAPGFRALLAAAVLAASLPGALASPVAIEAGFAPPAQAEGAIGVQGAQWALLLFRAPERATFDLSLGAGARQTNQTFFGPKSTDTSFESNGEAPVPPAGTVTTLPGPVEGRADFAGAPWASLFIVADSVALSAPAAWADVVRVSSGDSIREYLPPVSHPRDAVNLMPPDEFSLGQDGAALRVASAGGDGSWFPVAVQVRGLRHVGWHNATVRCWSEDCPDSGAPLSVPLDPLALRLQRLSYIHVDAPTGSLDGSGHALAVAVGGPSLDLVIDGILRLPDAALAGQCGDAPCPDPAGQTFLADGNLTLARLRPDEGEPARMSAQLSGHFANAAFDEIPRGEFTAARVAAGLAVLGLAWAFKAAWGLFARSARPPALQHPRRREMFGLVQAEPGLSSRALQRRLGWSTGTLRFHLDRLVQAKVIAAQPHRNTVRYFPNHGQYAEWWKEVAELRDPDTRRLHDWLLAHPTVGQACIVAETASWGWGRSKTRGCLRRLRDAGLVSDRRDGKRAEYVARPARANGWGGQAGVAGTGRGWAGWRQRGAGRGTRSLAPGGLDEAHL